MSALNLYKQKNLNDLFIHFLKTPKNISDLDALIIDINMLQKYIFEEIVDVKEKVLITEQESKENFIIKKILKVFQFIEITDTYLDQINEYVRIKYKNKGIFLEHKIYAVLNKNDSLKNLILKDINLSNFINKLLNTSDVKKYKVILGLAALFRTDIKADIRNSVSKYKIDMLKNDIDLNVKAFFMKQENFYWIDKKTFDNCEEKTKILLQDNKEEINSSKYFIVYHHGDLNVAMKDKYLNKKEDFQMWINTMRNKKNEKDYLNNLLESLIISFNDGTEEVFKMKNYLNYKLQTNQVFKDNEMVLKLYERLHEKILNAYSYQEKKEYTNAFEKERELTKSKLNALGFFYNEKFKISSVLENTFRLLKKELGFSYKKISKIQTKDIKLITYSIQFKRKNIIVSFKFGGDKNDCSLLVPYYENGDLSPMYKINIALSENNLESDILEINQIGVLFHELGHLFNSIFSNFGDFNLIKMEEVEIPSIFMEELMMKKSYLNAVIGYDIEEPVYDLLMNYVDISKKETVLETLVNGYIYNKLFTCVNVKGDLKKCCLELKDYFNKYQIKINEDLLFEHNLKIEDWNFNYAFFDYVNTNFVYLLGYVVTKNMIKNEITLKKAFTNLFKYDMIKNDQCYWSKYVDF